VGGNEIVVVGTNTSAGGTATNAVDTAADAAYSDGWNNGNNGGTGFLGWQLTQDANAGHFASSNGWGLWSHSNNLSQAVRPFTSSLSSGMTFAVRIKNGWILEGLGGIGVGLQNAGGDTLWQFWFNGGDNFYNRSGGTTDVGWTDAPIDLTLEMTSATSYNLTVLPQGGPARNYSGTLEANADQTVARFRAWSWSNGEGSNYDYLLNNLLVTSPSAASVVTNSDFVIITRQAGGEPVPPQISNIDPTLSGDGIGFILSESINGATYAIWASSTLYPSQNWQRVDGTDIAGTGGTIDLSITNGLLPTNFYRVGYTVP
jgi:hypothetical protein